MSLPASAPGPSWQERGRILRPRLPAFWLFAFLVTIGALGAGGIIADRVSAAPSSSLFAITLLIAWGVPLVVVIHALDLFEREPFGMLAAAFAWGSLAATTLAISANTAFFDLIAKLGSQSLADRWGAAIAGPIDEETLKALGLLLLVLIAAAEIDTPIDGLVYGAFIGLGFQIVEDFTYLTNPAFSGDGFSQTHVVWELFVVRGLVGRHLEPRGLHRARRARDRLPRQPTRRVAGMAGHARAAGLRRRLDDALRLELALARERAGRRLLAPADRAEPHQGTARLPADRLALPASAPPRVALGRARARSGSGDRSGHARRDRGTADVPRAQIRAASGQARRGPRAARRDEGAAAPAGRPRRRPHAQRRGLDTRDRRAAGTRSRSSAISSPRGAGLADRDCDW